MRPALLSLICSALIAASAHSVRANPVCRTELADGRVLFTQPVMGQDGMFCRGHDVFDRRHDVFARQHQFATPLPHMNFTTGEIGPFTTFSNSPPNGTMRHR
jgi:hypothetical protein